MKIEQTTGAARQQAALPHNGRMLLLLLVSLVWAFSFSLIKTHLAAVPPDVVNAARLGLAALVFLPFLRPGHATRRQALELAALGALQFGLMAFCYTRAFAYLKAHETALATVMTPIYVVLVSDLLDRRFRPAFAGCALLSVAGTALSLGLAGGLGGASLKGLALVQASNLCFALGQVGYRRALSRMPGLANAQAFAWCALGGAAVALVAALPVLARGGLPSLTGLQLGVLAYLGLVASGLCFFLWNVGARRVNPGVLGVMNDLKIPLAIAVALLVFRERAAGLRLVAGGGLVLLAWGLSAQVKEPAPDR